MQKSKAPKLAWKPQRVLCDKGHWHEVWAVGELLKPFFCDYRDAVIEKPTYIPKEEPQHGNKQPLNPKSNDSKKEARRLRQKLRKLRLLGLQATEKKSDKGNSYMSSVCKKIRERKMKHGLHSK